MFNLPKNLLNEFMLELPYSRLQAWLYLTIKSDNGVLITTLTQLSKIWEWSIGKVSNFIKKLNADGLITIEKMHNFIKITIISMIAEKAVKSVKKEKILPQIELIEDDKYNSFIIWCKNNTPEILNMKKPISCKEFHILRDNVSSEWLRDKLIAISNDPKYLKRFSAYRTLINWWNNKKKQTE